MKIFSVFLILMIKINFSSETEIQNIKVFSEELFQVSCDTHFFYLSMLISSDVEIINPISFDLNLVSPSNLRMKCMIYKSQFECFSFVPDGRLYRQEELFFNLFYTPPKIKGIDFDIKSFRKNSRRWENTTICGAGNYLLNETKVDFNQWKKIRLNNIEGGECKYNYEDKEQKNLFYYNMSLGIEDENLIKLIKENNESISFIQEIKAPISLKYQDYSNHKSIQAKDYAFCKYNDLVSPDNYKNVDFLCKISIPKKKIINSEIKFHSFFDKVYIKAKNEIKIINIFVNTTNAEFTLKSEKNTKILCPNLPIFTIKNKNTGIYYSSYDDKTNLFFFYLKGILSNGYKYTNDSLIKITHTTKDIYFNLSLVDNSLDNLEETQAKCVLNANSFYNEEDTIIKCSANKTSLDNINNNENIIIDMNLNYIQKKNNYFDNIIINWPERQYFGNKKNFFSVKIYALSIKRKYSVCEDGSFFTFYINIYDINKEIKIFFELPLLEPMGYIASCELFDHLTLVCTIDLRYKKILKSEKISLPARNKEIRIINDEGNEIIFKVNDDNNFIKLEEDCGENVVFGAMKEIGISKTKGIIISVCIIVFLLALFGFSIFYIIHRILRCKQKGKKLPMTEESKIQKDFSKE